MKDATKIWSESVLGYVSVCHYVANMGLVLLCRRGYILTPYNDVTCGNVMGGRDV